jgi:hypothetical protein
MAAVPPMQRRGGPLERLGCDPKATRATRHPNPAQKAGPNAEAVGTAVVTRSPFRRRRSRMRRKPSGQRSCRDVFTVLARTRRITTPGRSVMSHRIGTSWPRCGLLRNSPGTQPALGGLMWPDTDPSFASRTNRAPQQGVDEPASRESMNRRNVPTLMKECRHGSSQRTTRSRRARRLNRRADSPGARPRPYPHRRQDPRWHQGAHAQGGRTPSLPSGVKVAVA